MKLRLKIWLESDDGEPIMGDGRLAVLRAVERTGSLSAAARELGMSYRSLWGKVRTMEKRLGLPLVSGSAGGAEHGGATLSDDAKRLIAQYDLFTASAHDAVAAMGRAMLDEINQIKRS